MPLPITLLYACVFAIFALALSFRVGAVRGKSGISILVGEPQNMELAERVRAHQNFLEYVPLFLIVMGAVELSGGSANWLHGAAVLMLIGRVGHAIGLKHDNMSHKGRLVGMLGTIGATLIVAIYGLIIAGKALL
jgi:uncharacterized membrane protein YecN with MAPEG domain